MGTRLILVRHCEAEGNFRRLFQGSTDAPVSEKGRVQLDLLSVRCRNMAIDRIYTSPLRRARMCGKTRRISSIGPKKLVSNNSAIACGSLSSTAAR